MALKRRTQVQVKAQTVPGTAATGFAGSDVVEVLEADFGTTRSLIDRQPATQSLSNSKKAVGAGTSTLTMGVDWRGGRTDGSPDFDVMLQSCGLRSAGVRTITLTGGGALGSDVKRGHILEGDASGARLVAVDDADTGATSFRAIILTPDVGFSASENLDNKSTAEDGVGAYASDAAVSGAAGYHPVSLHRLQMTLSSGTWTGDTPTRGDGVTFSSSGDKLGGGIVVSVSGPQLVVEMQWGDVAASNDVTATGSGGTSGTNTVSGTPAFAQVIWPYVTIRHNTHNREQAMEDTVGTFSVTGESGAALQANFEFTGKKGSYGEEDFLVPNSRNSKIPPLLQKIGNSSITVNGIKLPVVSIDFSAGMESVVARDANRTEGIYRTESTARNPTLSVTIQRVPTSTIDLESAWKNGDCLRVAIAASGGTNNDTILIAPNCQIANVTEGEDSGLVTDTMELELTGTVEDDEFAILFGTL